MKICIIGSGLTAQILAKSLIDKKIIVEILPSDQDFKLNSTRTIGISFSNQKFLESLFPKVNRIGHNINQIKIYNDGDNKKEIIDFNKSNKTLFSIFNYKELFSYVKKGLNNEKLLKKKKLINSIKKVYDKKKIYNLIIDTELNNTYTKKFFFRKIKKNYHSTAYTTLIEHKNLNNFTARQIFTKNGPLAFLPMSKNKTSIVFSVKKNKKLTKEDFYNLIKKYNNFYSIKKFYGFEYFRLEFSLLKNYYHENILAFGDPIHKIHPLAGQGFNMTLRDIKNLSKIIDKRVAIGLPPDVSTLCDFENKMKHKNLLFANSIDLIFELFNFENKMPINLSQKIFSSINKSKFLKNLSMRFADKGL